MKKKIKPPKVDDMVIFDSHDENPSRHELNGRIYRVKSLKDSPHYPQGIAVELESQEDLRVTWADLDEFRHA